MSAVFYSFLVSAFFQKYKKIFFKVGVQTLKLFILSYIFFFFWGGGGIEYIEKFWSFSHRPFPQKYHLKPKWTKSQLKV